MPKPIQKHTARALRIAMTDPIAAREVDAICAAGGGTLSAWTRMRLAQLCCDKVASDQLIAALQAGTGGLGNAAKRALSRGLADHATAGDIAQSIA